jgi:hypothetical protein
VFLAVGQRLRVDDVKRVVFIDDEHDLYESAAVSPAPYEPLVIALPLRVRRLRMAHDLLGFVRRDAMLRHVVEVPFIPAKVHRLASDFL